VPYIPGVELWLIHHLLPLALAAAPVAIVATATIDFVKQWFQKRTALKGADRDRLAFSIKANLDAGNYAVQSGVFGAAGHRETIVQGFYDKKADRVVASRTICARKLAPELAELHQQPLAVWE